MATTESSSEEFFNDVESSIYCLHYITKCSWWEWNNGYRFFFLKWTPEFKTSVQDGIRVCWINKIRPKSKRPQSPISGTKVHKQVQRKMGNVKELGSIHSGCVKMLIRYFSAPKLDQDVCMVYDETASGFNNLVWVLNFGLPSVKTLLCATLPTSWMVDLYIEEVF